MQELRQLLAMSRTDTSRTEAYNPYPSTADLQLPLMPYADIYNRVSDISIYPFSVTCHVAHDKVFIKMNLQELFV